MLDPLTLNDAPAAAALSAAFGWPHRVEDWRFFLGLGHGVAWREKAVLCGTALWFPLDAHHAAIGLVQVSPEMQGRGIGKRLMQAVMDGAQGRSLLLHATKEGAGLYAALGFAPRGLVQQWHGTVAAPAGPAPAAPPPAAPSPVMVHRMDAAALGFLRQAVLDALAPISAGAMSATGYALRRRFGRGQLIGPVIAETQGEAITLVEALRQPGFLRLDIPAHATTLTTHLAAMGLACAGEVQAMARGPWPTPPGPLHCFGLASQAFG